MKNSIPSLFSMGIILQLLSKLFSITANLHNFYQSKLAIHFLAVSAAAKMFFSADSGGLTPTENLKEKRVLNEINAKNRFFNFSLDMLCVIGFDGYFKLVNATTTNLLGYSESELLAKEFIEFVHPKELKITCQKIASLADSNSSQKLENRYRCKDGSYKSISWTINSVREEELIYAVGRDITGCQSLGNSILESILDRTEDLIFVKDTQGEYVSINSKTAAFFGKSKTEILGKKDTDLFSEKIVTKLLEIDRRVIQSGIEETVEEVVEDIHGNLETYLATKSPWRDQEGNIIGILGVTRPITDRKTAEEQLRQKAEFLRSIYDGVDYIIFVVDVGEDGEFRYVGLNPAAELLGGISTEEAWGKTPQELFGTAIGTFFRTKLRECLQKQSSISYEAIANFEGKEVCLMTNLTPLRDKSGQIYRIVGSCTDISDRKKAEQSLEAQLKLSVFTAEVGIALTQNPTLAATLQKCCDAVVDHLDAAFARIWTLNPDDNILELQASGGIYTHIDGAHSRIPVGEFKIGLIAQELKPHLTNAVLEDPHPHIMDKEWASREGLVAFAGYPLIVDNQLVGVIAMFCRQQLKESTQIALPSIADTIALGIKRKQTEVALGKQQQTLRGIIDNAPIWVWMTNTSGRMLLVNKTFCEDVAIPESKFLAASHYSEVLGVEESANCMASDVQAWSQDCSFYCEEILQLADGELHHLEIIKTKIKDDTGSAIGLIGLGLDVTEQKEYQRKLQESEARFRKLAEQEKLVNQLASQIRASLDLDTILGTTVHQIRDLLQVDRCLFIWYQPDAEQPVWNVTYEAKNPDLPSLLGLYPTAMTGSHAALIANLEIIRIDDFEAVNDGVERDFFLSIGFNSLLDIPIQTPSSRIGLICCATSGITRCWSDEEVELLVAVGNQLTIAINQAELYTQSLDSARIAREQATKIERALYKLQQAQTQLIQAEKMSSLGQMVAGIAHEINNPISFIFGNLTYTEEYTTNLMRLLQMYREEFPEPPPAIQDQIDSLELDFLLEDLPKMLSSMKVGATRIRDIVRSLRNFSRLDESDMKSVNLHEGIDSTLMILEHRLKAQPVSVAGREYHRPIIQVIKQYGELPLVDCYAGLLNQVFMNIIANAIDAVEEQSQNPGIIHICTQVEGNLVEIAIADNGVGMTDRVKQRIFDPFYTTKAIGSGTGMGLAISHSIIVEKHQGEINCISALGKGTEFIIKIPIVSH
ncbi:PAS domain S-box protein [Microcoleus sp.]|uniref:PAS domain S-box protein n=1 Tax=Microcoleus sp. TaxID=44472 RepID=UPI003526602D